MALTRSRHRTATGIGTLAATTLVVVCGSPIFVDWVNSNTTSATAGGLFLHTLAWPHWSFDSGVQARDLWAQDLKAVLVVAFTAAFLTLLAGAELARGSFAAFINGWGAYIFAGAFAGFVTAFLSVHAGLYTALAWALGGAGYGLLAGWIIGLAQLSARRP